MSDAIAFDTYKFVKHLTEKGFTEEQAGALADEQVNLLNSNLATKVDIEAIKADIENLRLATKADIEKLRLEIKADIEKLQLETKADIEKLQVETKADIEKLQVETKADIEKLQVETKADIGALRRDTRADIEALNASLVKWMFGALIAQGGLIVALIKLL